MNPKISSKRNSVTSVFVTKTSCTDSTPNATIPNIKGKNRTYIKFFHSKPLGTHYTIITTKKRLFKSVISNSINYKKKEVLQISKPTFTHVLIKIL